MSDAQKEVELDLDDVQEENVEIETNQEPAEESVKDAVGEVDLGYTDPMDKKEETPSEPEPEKSQDNLQDVSEKNSKAY